MAGTVTITRTELKQKESGHIVEKVQIDWVADASAATVPNTSIAKLHGYLVKAITNPGATNPTANYTIKLLDPDVASFDSLEGKLASRSATLAEEVYPTAASAMIPIFLAGDYTFSLSGNSVNSANGSVILYLKEYL